VFKTKNSLKKIKSSAFILGSNSSMAPTNC